MDKIALGQFIRSRRQSMQPEDVGLRRGARRRTAGLRREEVAELSDMSADYLARLERGAGPQPSEQMIGALARGLRLKIDERDHVLMLAGHPVPTRAKSGDHVSPGLMRVLDRLVDTPAQVMGPIGETLAQNPAAVALLGDQATHTGLARSVYYRWFTDPSSRTIYPTDHHNHHGRIHVSQLRRAVAQLGPESDAARLAHHLREKCAEFSDLWAVEEIGLRYSQEKCFLHPEVGELYLYCQVVVDPDRLQTLLVFTATPGTESSEKVELLAVLGRSAVQTK